MEASGAYRYFYESLMKAVTINSGNVSILPGLYEDISDYYEQLERILHPVDNDYRANNIGNCRRSRRKPFSGWKRMRRHCCRPIWHDPGRGREFRYDVKCTKILFLEEKAR